MISSIYTLLNCGPSHAGRIRLTMATDQEVKMRAILDIFLAVIFTIGIGGFGHNIYQEIKKESFIKVQEGLSSLSDFTRKLTQK